MRRETSRFAESTVFEGMTSIRAVIASAKSGVSDRRIEKVLIDRSKVKTKEKDISYLSAIADEMTFYLEYCDDAEIEKITVGSSHGGIVALCSERTIPPLDKQRIAKQGFYVMIEGIEDPYNFGYAIRTIYASGADGVVLTPRNWMTASGVVCRSSAGASELIPLFQNDASEAINVFRSCGYKIVAAGIRDSVSAYDADLSKPIFLIIGGEKRGISRAIIDRCDRIVKLDYGRKFKGSLSAASAASILSYEVFRQNK